MSDSTNTNDEANGKPPQDVAMARQLKKQRRVRILIPSGREQNERSPVQVSVNGQAYLIKRDIEVNVPEAVLNVLDLAVENAPVQTEVDGQIRTIFKQARRYVYQRFGYVNDKGELVK